MQMRHAVFVEEAWICGRTFKLSGRLPILPLACSPAQVLLRATPDARIVAPTFTVGDEHELWLRMLRRELAPFVVGATMALVGLLFLAAGVRRGAERAYRGLGLFLTSLGTLAAFNTLLRHVLPISGTAIFYVHEVMTSLYPLGFADFLLGTFGDGPWKVLQRGLRLFVLYVVAAWTLHFVGVLHIDTGRIPAVFFISVFLVQGIILAARARKTDPSANVFLVGIAALLIISIPDIFSGAEIEILPFQTVHYAVLSFGIAMVVMVERQHRRAREEAVHSAQQLAAKLTALEERNREINSLNSELRHQIAERSKEMAESIQVGKTEARAARKLEVGDVIDNRYRVTRTLGRGAMGTVQAVERISDGRVFALKMMRGAVDAQGAARFAREAEIAARVADEHLVKVVDLGGAGSGQLYLVMEYVDGRPLEDHRSRFGKVPWAIEMVAQIAAGVRALHAAGVVHRDLKPGNVLLTTTAEGRECAKISDFGISRRGEATRGDASQPLAAPAALPLGGETNPVVTMPMPPELGFDSTLPPSASHRAITDAPLTAAGMLLGTPTYMAPELARGAENASPASDVFALGLIAYELLSGKNAFEQAPLYVALARRHLPKVAALPADVPPVLAALVFESLAEKPDARPTADKLADAFRAAARADQ
ncbi:MAG: protein kinase [Archangium sp.]|nr:protein kinase [Archangium sp.]